MAADKLKKLEAKGRAAFVNGDIRAATRFFTQALERYSNSDHSVSTTPETRRKKSMPKGRTRSMLCVNNNDEDVWILQPTDKGKRNKKCEKTSNGKKKEGMVSSLVLLGEIITEAETTMNTNPGSPLGYQRKASALILLNKWEEAKKTYTTGLEYCPENDMLKSSLLHLDRTHKITSCAASLDLNQLTDLVNQNSLICSTLPSTPTLLRRNQKFRLQSQRRLTKKLFPAEIDATSEAHTSFRRRNSSSTDTHF